MHMMKYIKYYHCTFLLMIIITIGLVSLFIPHGIYAQSVGSIEKANSTECECKFEKSCFFNYYFAEQGTFQCVYPYSDCQCTGPVQFVHCGYPEAEKCTRISGNSCSPCPSEICDLCYPTKCVGCYQFDLVSQPSECEYDDWECYNCIYRVTPLGDY